MIRVLLVDDEPLVRGGFAMLLENAEDIEVIGEADDGAQAIQLAGELRPDVVCMDIRMPELDGVAATRQLLSEATSASGQPERLPKVLILTTFDLDEYVYEAIRAGASGFLLKDAVPAELVQAVRVVARGDALLAPRVTRRLIGEFANRPEPAAKLPKPRQLESLTDREREVLALAGRGLSNAEMAGYLYLGEATVKTHISRLLMKLGLRDRAQLVVAAYETGLIKPGQRAD